MELLSYLSEFFRLLLVGSPDLQSIHAASSQTQKTTAQKINQVRK